MNIVIRPVSIEDSEDINELRRMKGVMENTLARLVKEHQELRNLQKILVMMTMYLLQR